MTYVLYMESTWANSCTGNLNQDQNHCSIKIDNRERQFNQNNVNLIVLHAEYIIYHKNHSNALSRANI